ncbi:unnamed protein product [Vitrella brassicaformis CCMP3155]|uniref:HIT domain-containing protein n=2 Tax=Vitrella brassicaformis TaxID=1169539 RepID=A0A0G4F6J9_VITBC|nr:unnamed protein product [Vitrella brassicaformis CCMP3155]|eukprot:CEM07652.1 unnamed protein product [Vitrella brassicaformis CCMP3155]
MAGDPNEKTIFDKIVSGEMPSHKVYEDERVLAFKDVNPKAPTHILIIPKNKDGLSQLRLAQAPQHVELLGHLMCAIAKIAHEQNLGDYRIVINDGPGAGQSVYHLHAHLLAGRPLGWPPG